MYSAGYSTDALYSHRYLDLEEYWTVVLEPLRGHLQWQMNTLNVRYVGRFRNSPDHPASFSPTQSVQASDNQLPGPLLNASNGV
jgi:hypothetical protein